MRLGLPLVLSVACALLPHASSQAEIFSPRSADLMAKYQIEGLYDMVGLGTWNGQPVSETNQPSLEQRRLAADVSLYSDPSRTDRLWITVTGIVTTQGAWWWGSPARDVQLTGIGLRFVSENLLVSGTSMSGDYALVGQRILTEAGSVETDLTPGYTMNVVNGITQIQCANGTDYGMTNFGWVRGLTVLTNSAVFQVTLDRAVSSITWASTAVTGRFGVDHQLVSATLVPGPGPMVLIAALAVRRRRA